MANGVWFRLNVGRERNADPKWLLPEICRQGEVTKKDIGAIRVFEMETLFQIDAAAAPKFTILVSERKKGGVRISPALNQTGESTARPREKLVQSDTPGDAPPRKPGFHGKKFVVTRRNSAAKNLANRAAAIRAKIQGLPKEKANSGIASLAMKKGGAFAPPF
jgi:ATP-dependent RNA helicase DeaD